MPATRSELENIAGQVLDLARARGATEADAYAVSNTDFKVSVAGGKILNLTQAASKGVGVRVFVGKRLGLCQTIDFRHGRLAYAVGRAVEMAKASDEDPFFGLPEEAQPGWIDADEDLDIFDPRVLTVSTQEKIRWALALEEAARAANRRVTRIRDCGVETNVKMGVLATSRGVIGSLRHTHAGLWCRPIAQRGDELQTEIWQDARTHLEDLESVESIGRRAGQRAARMLGARPIGSQKVAVVFEPHMAAALVAGMLKALNGNLVHKRASFLVDKKDEVVAARALTVVDDPLLRRGARSTAFDGEGLPTQTKAVIDSGVLTTFLYDSYTARKAGVRPTANALRSDTSPPHAGPFNFYVARGGDDPDEILRSAPRALLVTRALGPSVNPVSGGYSRGANGLWVEKGEVVHPVHNVTIAGEFLRMLQNIDAVGTDWRMVGRFGAPTLRIRTMTVAGR